ncbi:hypothetical protein NDGK_00036 [Clostridiales bacterium CHKCI001]|nr:hypothetical protein NDGK_00036 [Clostridiales bacterium CHKCI001]
MLELKMIEHCSPTLAGLKTANIFNYRFSSIDILLEEIQAENQKLNRKGVFIEILKIKDTQVLLYVYRKKRLEYDLKKDGVKILLSKYGYTSEEVEACILKLKSRLSQYDRYDSFPHEIGLFLSYPLEDVIGFIEQEGKNYKCRGLWKVYCNECEAVKLFAKFKKCTAVYMRLFTNGRSITQLTVAA